MDITHFKQHPKTRFLAESYERLLEKERELRSLHGADVEAKSLAAEELMRVESEKATLHKRMQEMLTAEEENAALSPALILEVRAGVGGEEAALFARELTEMYKRFAAKERWQATLLDVSESESGGYKEAFLEIRGPGAYRMLRFETGIHRIQRVPATEKSGRIHTSTASVAILEIREQNRITVSPADLDIEFSRSGGRGGQNVNKVETAVRIIHRPTGISVRCTSERTQQRNRAKAMSTLLAKLEMLETEKEAATVSARRREQIGTADRSEKIRTYNVLQDRVTDHRIKKSWYHLPAIMRGELTAIMEALTERLAEKS